jgi:DNA-directed RNA polymerase specialized sigma24 family protein
MVLSRKIAGAMADQLDRVNSRPPDLLDQIVKLQEEVNRLKEELRRERQRHSADLPRHDRDAIVYQGMPFFSLPQAAKKAGVSYWKAYRLVQANHWKHEINDSGKYLVYADQPLTIPPRKQKSRRKH